MTTTDGVKRTGFRPLPVFTDLVERGPEMRAIADSVAAAREAGCRPDSILAAVHLGLTGEKVSGDDRWRLERVEA